jgi:FdhD protein
LDSCIAIARCRSALTVGNVSAGPNSFGGFAARLAAMPVPPQSAARVDVLRLPSRASERDELAVEEPLEIRVNGSPVAVTMRTPGHDEELALGFLRSEGIPAATAHPTEDLAANVVEVEVGEEFDLERLRRNFYTSSSCGVCGKGALEAVAVEAPAVTSDLTVSAEVVADLPERLRESQPTFAATGGLHATGLFDADGGLICVREDVGRHNAMDKVIGHAFLEGLLPLAGHMLCVSGRLSFELVQKAAVAGCPIMVAVGAPSSLAVELARDRGLTLCGFVREGRVNVYTEPGRIR